MRVEAEGPANRIAELAEHLRELEWPQEAQERLFPECEILKNEGGHLDARVGRNYGGMQAIGMVIERYPDLYFHGWSGTDGCESLYEWEGRNGEMKWAREKVEWHPGFFTAYSESERLDGQTQKARIEVADPSLWGC